MKILDCTLFSLVQVFINPTVGGGGGVVTPI